MRFVILLMLSAGMSFAGTWSGALVDAKCWGFRERNVNPQDTLTFVDRDRNLEIGLCTPNAKTSLFAIVPQDGVSLDLDAVGNAQAAQLVRTTARKKPLIEVNVTGEVDKHTIAVAMISAAK
jgi:hypothetical protein